jgi:hypothetical protein
MSAAAGDGPAPAENRCPGECGVHGTLARERNCHAEPEEQDRL